MKLCFDKMANAWLPWMLVGSAAGALMFWP